jgi:hypothetical protein
VTTEDKRLQLILKLLAQAEGTNHPEEAKTFSAKAQKLMTEWQVDEAKLAEAAAASGAPVQELPSDEKVWMPGTMYKASTVQVWNAAMEANGVKLIMVAGERFYENWKKEGYTRPYIRGTYYHLFGFEKNILLGKMLAASLMVQMEREFRSDAVQQRMRWETTSAPSKVQWKNGFIFGYASAVSAKLQAAKRAATREPGTELVLVRRDELVQKSVADTYPKLGKSSSTAGQGYNSSRTLGREAGSRANVGGTDQIATSRKKELHA